MSALTRVERLERAFRVHEVGVIPPGWKHNPSSWDQRLPIVAIAVVGTIIAGYLGAYQIRLIGDVWEPFFGNGSRVILDSGVSRVLPIPDAILGMLGYVADAVAGVVGGVARWRRMPWIVVLFGLAVGPLGGISILLVILQPVLFDTFCTLCLATAVASVAMIGPAFDEVLATLQHLRRVATRGRRAVWRAFWGLDELAREESR